VRLWNYLDRTCELDRSFTEEAHCVAIHPTGTMVLVSHPSCRVAALQLWVVAVKSGTAEWLAESL